MPTPWPLPSEESGRLAPRGAAKTKLAPSIKCSIRERWNLLPLQSFTRCSHASRAASADTKHTRGAARYRPSAGVRLLLAALSSEEPVVDAAAERSPNNRGDPEHPQLSERPSSDEHCGARAACRVHRKIGDRNPNQVNQR